MFRTCIKSFAWKSTMKHVVEYDVYSDKIAMRDDVCNKNVPSSRKPTNPMLFCQITIRCPEISVFVLIQCYECMRGTSILCFRVFLIFTCFMCQALYPLVLVPPDKAFESELLGQTTTVCDSFIIVLQPWGLQCKQGTHVTEAYTKIN